MTSHDISPMTRCEPFMNDFEPELKHDEKLKPFLEQLTVLEPLYHAAFPAASVEHFEKLVAPNFWETGASGLRYSRQFALKVLSERTEIPEDSAWNTSDWHLQRINEQHFLLTYLLKQPGRTTRRMSIWSFSAGTWQVTYHQGTVVL